MLDCHARLAVFKGGYEWRATDWDVVLAAVDQEIPDRFGPVEKLPEFLDDDDLFRIYDPFQQNPALFRVFAELESVASSPTEDKTPLQVQKEAILRFCNFFGPLRSPRSTWEPLSFGCYSAWVGEMASAIRLWDAIRTKDKDALRQYVNWHDGRGWRWCDVPATGSLTTQGYEPYLRHAIKELHWGDGPFRESDRIVRATELLALIVKEMTKDSLFGFWQSPHRPLALRVDAPDLCTAMSLQFALSVVENKEYRHCELCEKPFELGHQYGGRQGRADKTFCTVTCRVKSYQRRQATARKMRAEGAKLQAIAKNLGSDVKTIKRWLGKE